MTAQGDSTGEQCIAFAPTLRRIHDDGYGVIIGDLFMIMHAIIAFF